MTIPFTNAKVTLTQTSATAFQHLKDLYGCTIHMGVYKDKPLQIMGSVSSFQRLLMFSNSEMHNAVGDLEYSAYNELSNKLESGIADYAY